MVVWSGGQAVQSQAGESLELMWPSAQNICQDLLSVCLSVLVYDETSDQLFFSCVLLLAKAVTRNLFWGFLSLQSLSFLPVPLLSFPSPLFPLPRSGHSDLAKGFGEVLLTLVGSPLYALSNEPKMIIVRCP